MRENKKKLINLRNILIHAILCGENNLNKMIVLIAFI
jgi:hypothetical protein